MTYTRSLFTLHPFAFNDIHSTLTDLVDDVVIYLLH
jgi:hypothetical protein